MLLGIAAVAAVLYGWEVTRGGLAPIYSVAVKSMSGSWRAFFFGAFDPKASVTMDKLAGSFLPQALSARIFGFHPWSVALPQAIEGVITVLVMYRVVRRWAGAVPRGIPTSGPGGVPSGYPRGVPGGQADVPRSGFPGAGNGSAPGGSPQLGGAPGGGIGGNGWTKLLGSRFGPEVGWLYPLAVLALVLGLLWRRRTPRTGQVRGGFVMWGGWLATFALIYSKMSVIPHTAYVSALAPAVAALSAAGIVMLWRLYRAGDRRGWLLPAIVLIELAWTWLLWHSYAGFLPWVLWTATAAGVAAVVVLAAARTSGQVRTRLVTAGMAAGVAAMLAAPAAWALSVLDTRYAGSSFDAGAGPVSGGGFGGGGARPGGASFGGPGGGSGGLGTSTTLTAAEQKLYRYLTAHRDGASYLMAVQSWSAAAPHIMAAGQEVMPMGGFSGSVPEPSVAHVRQMVARGQLRFFMIGGGTGPGAGQAISTAADGGPRAVARWVQSACTKVPAKAYGGTAASGGPGSFSGLGDGGTTTGTLYRCGRNA